MTGEARSAQDRDLLRDAFDAGQGVQDGRARPWTFDEWYAANVDPGPSLLPRQPPHGAVCRGSEPWHLWLRWDDPDGSSSWHNLEGDVEPYERALKAGLDPARRLVELPDPGDRMAMICLANGVLATLPNKAPDSVGWAAGVVRALSGQVAPE